jgi:hypothetical protein
MRLDAAPETTMATLAWCPVLSRFTDFAPKDLAEIRG